jgi:RNA polymerase sigma factor (sigma-70 family)
MSATPTELELFYSIGQGDGVAAATLRERLRRCAYWVIRHRGGGSGEGWDVDEIVDECTLRLEQLRTRGFDGGAVQFRTFVYKVVASVCSDTWRRQRWVTSLDAPVTLPDGEEKPLADVVRGMVDPQLSADADVASSQEAARVRAALDGLDARCRRLLREFHVAETPIAELARREKARPNAIEVALTRCRRRLYAVFIAGYVEASDTTWRARVAAAARSLSPVLAAVFEPWWTNNRSVAEICRALGIAAAEGKRLLAQAKLEVWRVLEEKRAI